LELLFSRFRELGASQNVIGATGVAVKATREPIVLMVPAACPYAGDEAGTVIDVPISKCHDLPLYCLDKHTRLGRRAISLFAAATAPIAACLSKVPAAQRNDAAGLAVFYAEGELCNPLWKWREGQRLRSLGMEGDFASIDVPIETAQMLIRLVKENVGALNVMRRNVLSAAQVHSRPAFHPPHRLLWTAREGRMDSTGAAVSARLGPPTYTYRVSISVLLSRPAPAQYSARKKLRGARHMAARKTVTLRYRKFEDPVNAAAGMTLEQAIRDAMATPIDGTRLSRRWRLRQWRNPDDDTETMFTNHFRDGRNYLFADLIAYTEGRAQAMLEEEENSAEAAIETFAAPARRQFVSSMMFWLVTGNHVIVLQQGGLRSAELELYLTWLLAHRTSVCRRQLQVILTDHLQLGRPQLDDVRTVVIGGNVHAHAPEVREEVRHGREVQRIAEGGRIDWARRVLEAVLDDPNRVRRVLERVPDDTDITVNVEIGFDSRKRTISREALRRVARAVRNLPDSDFSVRTGSGEIKGRDLRLSHTTTVTSHNGLLARNEVLKKMIVAYGRFIQAGNIEATRLAAEYE
jgi:hypothetical protein